MNERTGRDVIERIFITGTLVLETPAHLGNGDAEMLTDMPLLRDPLEGRPLLTGASVAGALRSYLREYQHGYGRKGERGDWGGQLFGSAEKQTSFESWLLIDDALGESPGVELRDGVAINPQTRTAEDDKKFDVELLQAGTTFPLSFELLLTNDNANLLDALALALRGLEDGEIGLGQRKRRGLGQCRVTEWRVRRYRVTERGGLLAWLGDDHSGEIIGDKIFKLLRVSPRLDDRREVFAIQAAFRLDGSLLIRSGAGQGDAPDMVHLRSLRRGRPQPILSGTSLAGAVRARAHRIANTLLSSPDAEALVDGMFGKRIQTTQDKPTGSRVVTRERELKCVRDLVQSRVKIDRFTGGSFPTALFNEQPAFGGEGASVTIELALNQPHEAEIGLLLLVLKDLWTGDLPLGGERSVGRGRLKGLGGVITYRRSNRTTEWRMTQQADRLEITGGGTRNELEDYVRALPGYRRPNEH